MNKPTKVRKIYAELQRALGDDLSKRELLECASLIADATADSIRPTGKTVHHGRTPFVELPVSEVMDQWSWRVVAQEFRGEDDFSPQISQEEHLAQLLSIAA